MPLLSFDLPRLRLAVHRYADRDARKRWANKVSSGMNPFGDFGGIGGQLLGGAVRSGLSRVFR